MIKLKNIYKTFQRNSHKTIALNDVNLTVDKGDIFGVIGYSGAGKSTLIRLVNCLERPDAGSVVVDGLDMLSLSPTDLSKAKKQIGMIFQHFNLLENKTVSENIALPLLLAGMDKTAQKKRVTELLDFVELSEKANVYPKQLSGGQKQRVGIARALANEPKILLCDEATSALDPQTTLSILALLQKINRQHNITIMMVTHQMSVVEAICNKVAVMEQGVVIEQGKTLAIFGQPSHPTTQNFVNAILHTEIPHRVLESLGKGQTHTIYSLEFLGESARQSVVSELILQQKVAVNILFADMTEIEGTVLGRMFTKITGTNEDIEHAVAFLRNQGVRVIGKDYYV